jgi:hypothetical protein
VKFVALDIVCPLMSPEVIVPMFVRLRDESTICVPLRETDVPKLPVAA